MLFRNRDPRSLGARRRGKFRPLGEDLESRLLLSIDLGGAPVASPPDSSTSPPARAIQLPIMAGDTAQNPLSTQPYGVDMTAALAGQAAGYSVTDVGDLGNGYDDFVVGAPGVTTPGGTTSQNAVVYLIFGSMTTNGNTIKDWLNINANFGNTGIGRVGSLNQLGNPQTGTSAQTDPINGLSTYNGVQVAYPFAGVKFIASGSTGSELGESVAAAVGAGGQNAFLVGAPGSGKAYLISGGSSLLTLSGKQIDLDNLSSTGTSGLNVTTFTNTASTRTGQSVAGLTNFFGDGQRDIVIGAPNASLNGATGAVYVVDGSALATGYNTINLANVGQTGTGSVAGQIFVGATAGDQAGWSVADAGFVDGATSSSGGKIGDLLIGAPAQLSGTPGTAYLVYGSTNFTNQITTVSGVQVIPLAKVNAPSTTTPVDLTIIRGLRVTGNSAGNQTGWAVAGGGDFNADGFTDIMIGSPQFSTGSLTSAGRVDIFYGASVNSTTPLQGPVTLGAVPSTIVNATLTGGAINNMAGYSMAYVGTMGSKTPSGGNPILIGAPGYNNNAGTAYLLPPNPATLTGTNSLLSAESQPLNGTQLLFSTPGAGGAFFGASVSGRVVPAGTTPPHTADSDTIGDFIIGAPGYQSVTGVTGAGGAMIVEGAFIPLQVPASINTTIGVTKPFGPFNNINATTPATMQIYVFSNKAANFDPVTQIDPTTVKVNGVAFPNATIAKDPVDENNDGIEDAIITISPRSSIGLTSASTSLTISGRTLSTATVNPNMAWTGSAAITVAGGGGGGTTTGALAGALPIGFIAPTEFVAPFGPSRAVPTLTSLSKFSSYKPIPYRVAVQQYMPDPAFANRLIQYYYPKKYARQFGSVNANTPRGTSTLGWRVFTRGKLHAGKAVTYTHKQIVVPVNLQTERIGGQPRGFVAKSKTPRLK